MSPPHHSTLEAAVIAARAVLADPPAERWIRQARFAGCARDLVVADYRLNAAHPLAAVGRELRARLEAVVRAMITLERAEERAGIDRLTRLRGYKSSPSVKNHQPEA